jgi:hypothetical protein
VRFHRRRADPLSTSARLIRLRHDGDDAMGRLREGIE